MTTKPDSTHEKVDRVPAATAAILSAGALIAGSTAEVDEQKATWFGVEGPHCPSRLLSDETACPGCGLTRATSLTLQAETSTALQVNPAGPLVAILLLVTLGLSVDRLARPTARRRHRMGARWLRIVFITGLFAAWVWRALIR